MPKLTARFGSVAAVADGVAGGRGGRVAAELAVRTVVDGYFGGNAVRGVRRGASRAIEAANAWINAMGQRDGVLAGMATTLTLLILRGRMGHVFHVGDSRLYRFRDGVLDVLTTDHTPGLPGYRNVLTRAIGAQERVGIDYRLAPLAVHDRFLLCTDGMYGGLSHKLIRDILGRDGDPQDAAHALVVAALEAKIGDNATAVVIDVLALPPADAIDAEDTVAGKPILPLPRPGQTVDGFHLEAMLGDGPYTRVFRAADTMIKQTVLLKFPKPRSDTEAMLRGAFMREAWIAGRVRSPWVGEAVDVPPDRRSGLYTVLHFYAGESLEARLNRSPALGLAVGLDLAQKLGKAVAALHRAGIIHRDIKPDNVILEAGDRMGVAGLRLVDLGVARLPTMEDFPSAHTPGTPSFMAPELFTGAPGDEGSDQFALAVTIYRMFAGAYPYGEIEPFTRPKFKKPVSLQAHRPELPIWLDRTLARAFAIEAGDRFADVLDLVLELEHGAVRAPLWTAEARPLYERNPLAVWKVIAACLMLALIAALAHQRHDAETLKPAPGPIAPGHPSKTSGR